MGRCLNDIEEKIFTREFYKLLEKSL